MPVSFAELGVSPDLVTRLRARGITTPFPVQAATLVDALAGRDVCARAPTGSGKTLAFGIAVMSRAIGSAPRRPRALVLAPTRELAAQVQRELAALADGGSRRVIAVYGGTGYGANRQALARGVDVVVACPGRLEDLLTQDALTLGDVRTVVVDEADRMADMGFLPAVRRILDRTSDGRQVLLFSATLGKEIETLVHRYQTDPTRHDVAADEPSSGAVVHSFWSARREDRVALTARLVNDHGQALVFCRTRRGADRVARQLNTTGVKSVAIHGDRSQNQREQALATFAAGRARALVATDIAARGIHVDDMPCVVHFDLPADHTEYLHRSGRTGRAGRTGTVVSLVTDDQHQAVRTLQRALGIRVPIDPPSTATAGPPERTVPAPSSEGRSGPTGARPGTTITPGRARNGKPRFKAVPAPGFKAAPAPRPSPGRRSPQPQRQDARRALGDSAVGVVEFFDARKGYGFLSRHGDADDVFVHASNIESDGRPHLVPGQHVRFEVAAGRKGDEARKVTVV